MKIIKLLSGMYIVFLGLSFRLLVGTLQSTFRYHCKIQLMQMNVIFIILMYIDASTSFISWLIMTWSCYKHTFATLKL